MLSDHFDQREFPVKYIHVQSFILSSMIFVKFNKMNMMKLIKYTSELYSIMIAGGILCHLRSTGFKLNTHKVHQYINLYINTYFKIGQV